MIIAKSHPKVETLKEHTDELKKRFYELKKAYGHLLPNEKVWDLLYKAVLYHDVGKVNNDFQAKIHKRLKTEQSIPKSAFGYIPHNYLSPFFLPVDQWELTKKEKRILIQAIAFHHEREMQPDVDLLEEVYERELKQHFNKIEDEMDIELPAMNQMASKISIYLKPERRIREITDKEIYDLYVLVKGLLHRLDHAASAHVEIEIDSEFDLGELTKTYITRAFGDRAMRPLQNFTYNHQDKNLIIVAQTGMGKTEASLLWAGREKTFFTLPIRVSLNALYERVYHEMNYKNVGLLHSSSLSHLDENGTERWDIIHDQSRNFASKLLFTTIDQILKFPFKYKGYEKMLATMAYSKVIIDEIQAYQPRIVAVILKALEMIHRLGGRFMIMTATLPPIYIDEMKRRKIFDDSCLYKEFIDEQFIRHRVRIEDRSLEEKIFEIKEQGKQKKVLIIVNTVKRAIELYRMFNDDDNVKLLHSRFIPKDRSMLERKIKDFDRHEKHGIWITTQIVEASIDIDFDVLHTELSTIDSLLQRFGRCYRKRRLDHDDANVYIYTENVSGRKNVYDEDILNLTEKALRDYNGKTINEREKVELVKNIYSIESLSGTNYYKEFQKAVQELDNVIEYHYTQDEAQKVLRNSDTVRVIPRTIFDEIIEIFEALETEADLNRRSQLRREIEQHVLTVPRKMYDKSLLERIDFYYTTKSGRKYELFPDTFIIDVAYDFNRENVKGIGLYEMDEASFL